MRITIVESDKTDQDFGSWQVRHDGVIMKTFGFNRIDNFFIRGKLKAFNEALLWAEEYVKTVFPIEIEIYDTDN